MSHCQRGRVRLSGPDTRLIWARSGGACALCGADLLKDARTQKRVVWGELAHIIGAKPDAARGDATLSATLETDPDNIVLLCPSCHTKVDKDEASYPVERLRELKERQTQRVSEAARHVASDQALVIALTSPIAGGPNVVNDELMAAAMLQVGLVRGRDPTFRIDLPAAEQYGGRVADYWQAHQHALRHRLFRQLEAHSASQGQLGQIAFFGRADMPSLMAAGTLLGNRCVLHVFQPRRADGRWEWPDVDAAPPHFSWTDPATLHGDGPLALVFSLSARIPRAHVEAAFAGQAPPRIVEFTIAQPDHELVRGPRVCTAFHEQVRRCVTQLEAHLGADKMLHVFPAMPASLAAVFGAAIMLNYLPDCQIYDRLDREGFGVALVLPLSSQL